MFCTACFGHGKDCYCGVLQPKEDFKGPMPTYEVQNPPPMKPAAAPVPMFYQRTSLYEKKKRDQKR